MGILEEIITHKLVEVAERKELLPIKLLEKSPFFATPIVSLKRYLDRSDRLGVIAEIKRRSPSKGVLAPSISVERLSIGYMQGGASALSILTDHKYFGGSNDDLSTARTFNFCPILRKDFIVDEYQLIEAKSIGADVALLIVRALSPDRLKTLYAQAVALGLEVLAEVHDQAELERALELDSAIIGINNRDLDTLQIDITRSAKLFQRIPRGRCVVAESGLNDPAVVAELKRGGFSGFLIGEHFMKQPDAARACKLFIEEAQRELGARRSS